MDRKRFNFVLPFSGRKPVGGFKVVYEYANQLVKQGHAVTVTHTAGLYLGVNPNDKAWLNLSKYVIFGLLGNYLPDQWFKLNPCVKTRWVPSLHAPFVKSADYVIATSWETAEWLSKLPDKKGKAVYLIQGFEDWHASKDRVLSTWKALSRKIVISKWLLSLAESHGETACYIPNGLDPTSFGVDLPQEHRNSAKVVMLYSDQDVKGTCYGLSALEKVKAERPELEVTLFGVKSPPPEIIKPWMKFELLPSTSRLRELYNSASIFVSPSLSEGWALPPAEAMQCGCATVLTDIGGHEYATHKSTSLLSKPKDIRAMTENILELIDNPDLRIDLAKRGRVAISKYTWEAAADRFLRFVQEA